MADLKNNNRQQSDQPVVAIVDDEEMVTISIKTYLEIETDYRVLTFQSPVEALQYLKTSPPDIVISDFLMPEIDGLKFLAEFKKLYPETPRILLTAYADKENAIKAINDIGLFQYVEKPWDNDNLKLTIQSAISNKSLQTELQKRIHEMDQILHQRDEIFKINNLLQQELSLARKVHLKLLPTQNIEMGNISITVKYKPAFEIGGDFYDVIPLADNRTAIVIADLTGHGIQAALSTALIKFAFSAYKDSPADAAQIMMGMNDVLYRGLPSELFAAAMLVLIDTKTLECQILNGGIPHPYFLRRNNNQIEKIFANGMIIGILDNQRYNPGEIISIQLADNDCLILFSDGLTEARDDSGTFLGDKSVDEVIRQNAQSSCTKILDELVDLVQTCNSSNNALDDLTILGINASVDRL